MADRRYSRPRSPVNNPARTSLPMVSSYGGYGELHAVPTRREVVVNPRNSSDRVSLSPTVTTYKITPDHTPVRTNSLRSDGRNRRSTLDNAARPTIVNSAVPSRHLKNPDRPSSPLQNPYRSSDEGNVFTMPASSARSNVTRHRPSYSASIDDSDLHRARSGAGSRQLRPEGRRGGVKYPSSRPRSSYVGDLTRRSDSITDDYGDNGYGYTNPSDLARYDLDRSNPRYDDSRRGSYDVRSARPSGIADYNDGIPRSYDGRERGPPPSTRGFEKLSARAPVYETSSSSRLPAESTQRRAETMHDDRPSRRPVVYQDGDRNRARDDYYESRGDELPRERRHRSEAIDERPEGRRSRARHEERNGYESMNEPDKRHERERKHDRERRDDNERRHDHDRRDDYDRSDDRDDRHDHKSVLATGLSLAGAALGLTTLAKDNDRDDDERDSRRRREDDRRQRDERDDREDRESPDRKSRQTRDRLGASREERDIPNEERIRKRPSKDDRAELVGLEGRNPQEKHGSTDGQNYKESVSDRRDRRKRRAEEGHGSSDDSRDISPNTEERPKMLTQAGHGNSATPLNLKNTMDLRALREALNKQDTPEMVPVASGPPIPPKESLREAPFDPKDIGVQELRELREQLREKDNEGERPDRGRKDIIVDDDFEEQRVPRVVSPPRGEESRRDGDKPTPKGILRAPKEKFPEDPAPIREGVAPLKDAKKDGIPPDARWTKISRQMVNPEALELGKERYEARDDFVIVLRVLSREEIQGYAEVTQTIRAHREEEHERERRHRRRDRHERHKRDRENKHRSDRDEEGDHRHHKQDRADRDSDSESDTTEDDDDESAKVDARPPAAQASRSRRITFDEGTAPGVGAGPNGSVGIGGDMGNLKEDPDAKGVYSGYTRNPPAPGSTTGGRTKEGR